MTKDPIHISTPESSLIERIEYRQSKNPTMTVKLVGGKEYTYYNVPEDEYHKFAKAKSAGSHFGKHIKGKYRNPDEKA